MADLPYDFRKIRLFVADDLESGAIAYPDADQLHYLANVMRCKNGDRILAFNGRDGEWLCRLNQKDRRHGELVAETQSREQGEEPNLLFCFAPIKRAPFDYLIQKATELGVRSLQPVMTKYTMVKRVNIDRAMANATEAAEQSGRLTVPHVAEPVSLGELIDEWDPNRALVFCDEGERVEPIARTLTKAKHETPGPWGILVGPEGGFHPDEREHLRGLPFSHPVSLGDRILRADTAGLAALAIWQSILGDWDQDP